jgi:hypothetical protein
MTSQLRALHVTSSASTQRLTPDEEKTIRNNVQLRQIGAIWKKPACGYYGITRTTPSHIHAQLIRFNFPVEDVNSILNKKTMRRQVRQAASPVKWDPDKGVTPTWGQINRSVQAKMIAELCTQNEWMTYFEQSWPAEVLLGKHITSKSSDLRRMKKKLDLAQDSAMFAEVLATEHSDVSDSSSEVGSPIYSESNTEDTSNSTRLPIIPNPSTPNPSTPNPSTLQTQTISNVSPTAFDTLLETDPQDIQMRRLLLQMMESDPEFRKQAQDIMRATPIIPPPIPTTDMTTAQTPPAHIADRRSLKRRLAQLAPSTIPSTSARHTSYTPTPPTRKRKKARAKLGTEASLQLANNTRPRRNTIASSKIIENTVIEAEQAEFEEAKVTRQVAKRRRKDMEAQASTQLEKKRSTLRG